MYATTDYLVKCASRSRNRIVGDLPDPGEKRSSCDIESTNVDSSSSMAAVAIAATSPL